MAVTRHVKPEALSDFMERPPRAYLAFNDAGAIAAVAVVVRSSAGRYWIGITPGQPQPTGAVTLLIDDGWYWVELRAIKIRGRVVAVQSPPAGASSDLDWLELIPDKVVAWDYGSLREDVPHASS